MKKTITHLLFSAALGLATLGLAQTVRADNGNPSGVFGLDYMGTTVGGPTFNRPIANGDNPPTSLSGTGTAVPFDMVQFSIAVTGSYNFFSSGTFDNYTFLYQNSFDPANPLTNVLIGNDDDPSIGTSGFTYTLQTGVNYFFVTTGFANTDAGTFHDTVSLVPEPRAWLLMSAGLVGLVFLRRFRRLAIR
ncbi:MAG TPA: PEP-CTERM sorting domain-containing protein [Chthoniobacterales bacterium]|jgi:hypothetical protein|nr:PEP-CTERM sorting domain-containing protein [Chthoniobacterales bacterium]